VTNHRGARLAVLLALALQGCSKGADPYRPGDPLALDVGAVFPAGTALREAYTGAPATVDASGRVTVTPDPAGVVLLERDGAPATPFRWSNATIYFAMTDRFENGDPSNDASYGRARDGSSDIGTWHGGDWKGMLARLDHVEGLGADALWISPIVEQVHGWVGGGSGDFQHWAYHGYWALDPTRLDASFGTPGDLAALVDAAHLRGLRVLLDVVMNHPGYATGADLLAYLPAVFFDGTGDAFRAFVPPAGRGWQAWNDLVNYNSDGWVGWWSPGWIRAGFPHFDRPGTDDLTRQVAFLPDFKTESLTPLPSPGLPPLLTGKADTAASEQPGFTVRDYLVKWHSDWVRAYGFDGFRCDTARNVDLDSWKALKDAGVAALRDWKAANPSKKVDDADFWMVGEVYPHGVVKDGYFTAGGFDALLNFSFQPAVAGLLGRQASLAADPTDIEAMYAHAAELVSTDPTFDVVTYLSSHDTQLFYDTMKYDAALQRQGGTALLLAPGSVQVFYGDESGRRLGPGGSDPPQGTRSDMNWASLDDSILQHWRKLGAFRKRHAAVGAGSHARIASPAGTYAFWRRLDDGAVHDAVVVAVTAPR
jgi:alpha-amylase